MKTRKLIFGLSTIILAGSLMLTSCKKATTTTADDTESGSVGDNTYAENTANDINNIGSQASENGTLSSYKTAPGVYVGGIAMAPTATIVLTGSVITVDFGPAPGAVCLDGKKRSGKVLYDFSGCTMGATAYRHPGFKFTVSTQNYVVDSYTVNVISKTITNTTPGGFVPSVTNLRWNIASNIQIIKPGAGGIITWTCNRTVTLLNTSNPSVYPPSGTTPINWLLAKVQLDGTASGTNTGGESFVATATALVKDFGGCWIGNIHNHPIISGTLDYTPGTRALRHVDFGNGACDNTAVLTIKGQTYTFYF